MKTKQIGDIGEAAAAKFLKKNGYKVIERNLHISHNELDIVAIHKKQRVIAFVEVNQERSTMIFIQDSVLPLLQYLKKSKRVPSKRREPFCQRTQNTQVFSQGLT